MAFIHSRVWDAESQEYPLPLKDIVEVKWGETKDARDTTARREFRSSLLGSEGTEIKLNYWKFYTKNKCSTGEKKLKQGHVEIELNYWQFYTKNKCSTRVKNTKIRVIFATTKEARGCHCSYLKKHWNDRYSPSMIIRIMNIHRSKNNNIHKYIHIPKFRLSNVSCFQMFLA